MCHCLQCVGFNSRTNRTLQTFQSRSLYKDGVKCHVKCPVALHVFLLTQAFFTETFRYPYGVFSWAVTNHVFCRLLVMTLRADSNTSRNCTTLSVWLYIIRAHVTKFTLAHRQHTSRIHFAVGDWNFRVETRVVHTLTVPKMLQFK